MLVHVPEAYRHGPFGPVDIRRAGPVATNPPATVTTTFPWAWPSSWYRMAALSSPNG